MNPRLDATDRKILAQIQKDGRISLTSLGERVGLSLSPCQRRVRALEDAGIIQEYRARIDPACVGLTFSAIVFATLSESAQQAVETFEASLHAVTEIVQAQRLFGEPDYILHIVAKDLAAFQVLYDAKLSALPHVLRLSSTLVMKSIFENRPLPL